MITHEVYAVGRLPKCDPAGNYEQQQCDSLGCFCVNVNTGKLIPFSRQHSDAEMTCSGMHIKVSIFFSSNTLSLPVISIIYVGYIIASNSFYNTVKTNTLMSIFWLKQKF